MPSDVTGSNTNKVQLLFCCQIMQELPSRNLLRQHDTIETFLILCNVMRPSITRRSRPTAYSKQSAKFSRPFISLRITFSYIAICQSVKVATYHSKHSLPPSLSLSLSKVFRLEVQKFFCAENLSWPLMNNFILKFRRKIYYQET